MGIRKVLGATMLQIFNLLSREYAILLSMAMLVAIPVSYFTMSQWLNGFAYRISVSWWLFAIGGFMAFILAYLVIGYSTAKVATSSPVDHLRDE